MSSERPFIRRRPRPLYGYIVALPVLLGAGLAHGQAPAGQGDTASIATADLAAMPLEALMQVKVSTATLLPQRVADAPAAVVVLTAADIRDYGWRTLSDALASLPGLYTSYDRTYNYLGARGFHRPGDYNSRFLLLIDGMRINDAVYDQASIGTDFPLDLDLVERIEFVPGPGSAVYGSNALFGVINVVTKSGQELNGAQVATSVGSFGEKRARASYGWHGSNGADVLLSATTYDRSGQDLYFPEFDTPDQNNGVAQGLDYDRAQYLFAKIAYGDYRVSAGYGNRTKGVPTAPYSSDFNQPFSTTDTHSFVNFAYHHTLTPTVELAGQLFWDRYDYRSPGVYGADPAVVNEDRDSAIWYGADLHATFTGLRRHRIVLGADITRDASQNQYNFNVDPYQSILDSRRSSNFGGLYLEDEIELAARLTLTAGARIDALPVGGTNASPRLALIFKATPKDTFKLLYGNAYRAPNAYERYYTVPGPGGQNGNPTLKPERISTQELIYDRAVGADGHATLSLFQYEMRDLISEALDPDTGGGTFQNVDKARAKGLEFAYEQRFGNGARIRASYSWQIARDSATGTVLQDSPRHLGKLNLSVPLFHHAARLGTEVQCESMRLAAAGSAGGYCLGNVTIGSDRLIRHADVSFSVYNVTDKRYADPAGPGYTQDVIAQQSRTFVAKLVYGF